MAVEIVTIGTGTDEIDWDASILSFLPLICGIFAADDDSLNVSDGWEGDIRNVDREESIASVLQSICVVLVAEDGVTCDEVGRERE